MWLTGGVWVGAGGAGLHIFDALDETGLTNNPVAMGAENRAVTI